MPNTLSMTLELNCEGAEPVNSFMNLLMDEQDFFTSLTRASKKRIIEHIFSSGPWWDIGAMISILATHKELYPEDFKKLKFNRKICLNTDLAFKAWDTYLEERGVDRFHEGLKNIGVSIQSLRVSVD